MKCPKCEPEIWVGDKLYREHRPKEWVQIFSDGYCTCSGELAALLTHIKELKEHVLVDEALLDERNRLLDAMPECSEHGSQCVPHALEWIAKAVEQGITQEPQVEEFPW